MELRVYVASQDGETPVVNDLFYKLPIAWQEMESNVWERKYSFLNKTGSFLKDIYILWKHNSSDYVGFSQDDCFFACVDHKNMQDMILPAGQAEDFFIYNWSRKRASAFIKKRAIEAILPRSYRLKDISDFGDVKDVNSFYKSKIGDNTHFYDISLFLKEKYKSFYQYFISSVRSDNIFPWSIFLFRSDLFCEYCDFLFSVIDFLYEKYDDCELRKIDFRILSSVLLSVYAFSLQNPVYMPVICINKAYIAFVKANNIVKNIIRIGQEKKLLPKREILYGEKINIVMSFDDNYAEHAFVVINSMLCHTNNSSDIDLYIIHSDSLSYENIKNIFRFYGSVINIIMRKVDRNSVNDLPIYSRHISESTYYRFFIHDIVPQSVERVIYLDTDIVLCDDIVDLWNIDLQNYSIAAARDVPYMTRSLYGLESQEIYINAGVMILDLAAAEKRYGKLSTYFLKVFHQNQKRIRFQDQDVINLAFSDDCFCLPLRWNILHAFVEYRPALREFKIAGSITNSSPEEILDVVANPALIHFSGRRKPWQSGCLNPFKELYWHYKAETLKRGLSLKENFYRRNNYIISCNGFLCFFFGNRFRIYQLRNNIINFFRKLRLNYFMRKFIK